jgi:simple sugar transport system ATP-binding protein
LILEARGLRRTFGPLVALDDVDLSVDRGEVHAVLGENGAGKSTLMNVLFGALRPDAGAIEFRGAPVAWRSPADALAAGLGMVHQHFTLVPALTVAENVWLAHPARPRLRLRAAAAAGAVAALSDRFRLDLDPAARVEDLPVGARQRVEIAKALAREPSLLILDEPTAVLAPPETRDLFDGIAALREAGTSVLFISHKLDEVLEISDRITVLRRGRVTARVRAAEADASSLTRAIVGEPAGATPRETGARAGGTAGEPALEVAGLAHRRPDGPAVEADFELRTGELLGVAGVDGNGQGDLVALLAGVERPDAGTIRLLGRDVTAASPEERWRHGLSVLPGDRGREGLVPDATVWENLALREFGATWARRGPLVDPRRHVERARKLLARHDVRAAGPFAPAASLSGGNQQKLLLARELAGRPKVLVLLNPTRGLDVGAAETLLDTLRGLAARGHAVLLVSTELDEVLERADRVAVMRGGRWLDAPDATRETVGALMVGATA